MIHSVYVIHQLTGVCVVYRRYGSIEFNEDLIAGFLTALKDFSKEVTGGKGAIKVLDMQTYVIMLVFQEGVLVSAAADKQDDRSIGQNALQKILNEFLSRYGDKINGWTGDLKIFEGFENNLRRVLTTSDDHKFYLLTALMGKTIYNSLFEWVKDVEKLLK